MRHITFCFAGLLCCTNLLGQGTSAPLSPAEAAKKVNETVTVEFGVRSTGGVRNSYLNSEPDFSRPANFAIYIPETARPKFAEVGIPKPDEHYYGKTIHATGKVTLARDKPRIIVTDPTAIKIIAEKSGPPVRKVTHIYKRVGELDIRADSYQFVDRARQPVVVWIHGGALINGHRETVPQWLTDFARKSGCVLVSLDYRLAPETQLPDILTDIEDAFRWIRSEGPKLFQADPDRLAVVGGSAGGYLTLVTGHRVQPRPTALVSLWGYGDLIGPWYSQPSPHARHHKSKMSESEAFAQVSGAPVSDSRERRGDGGAFYQFCRQKGLWPKAVTGLDPHQVPEKFAPYMPLKNVARDYPPTLLIHGDQDTDVPHEQSVFMAAELKKQGVTHELLTVPGAEHGLAGIDADKAQDAFAAATRFLERHLTTR
jgi:acetyl esterase/lipase